jgi:ribosomal protein S18 acetylase RimI-like enzyme
VEGVAIREARPDEYGRIGALTVAAYRTLGDEALEDYEAELADAAGRAAVCPVLVAVGDKGAIHGTVTYVPGPGNPLAEQEREGEAGFRMLAVDPSARGRKVGRRLVEAAVERARREGRVGVAIVTRPTMTAAHRLYVSVGFERDPERDWEYEPGRWLWAMSLRLVPRPSPHVAHGAAPRRDGDPAR